MHLFLTDMKQQNGMWIIDEERVVYHCVRVLRLKVWDLLEVQDKAIGYRQGEFVLRRVVRVVSVWPFLSVSIESEEKINCDGSGVCMAVAIPNNSKKLSMIVQKLTELWVEKIVFWSAEYSQLTVKKIWWKLSKLSTVALEACEQSRRSHVPLIVFADDLWKNLEEDENNVLICFDQDGVTGIWWSKEKNQIVWWIVGPEWGFSPRDREWLSKIWSRSVSLWKTILRMETAAIVGAWSLVHRFV